MRLSGLILCVLISGAVAAEERDEVTLRILHSTDVHSHLEDGAVPGHGGWLRLAAKVAAERQRLGRDRVVLLDSGDACQGSECALLSRGACGAAMLKQLDYDAWAPGNHDLDFGPERFRQLIEAAGVPCLAANLSVASDKLIKPWTLIERRGWRLAVIGMQAGYLENWFRPQELQGVNIKGMEESLRTWLPEVKKSRPDLILMICHQGLLSRDPRGVNEVLAATRRFPEIRLVLGGHTHLENPGLLCASGSWYVQAGFHGDKIAAVDLHFVPGKGRAGIESELLDIGSDPADPAARLALKPYLDAAAAEKIRPICKLAAPLKAGKPGQDCALSAVLGQALIRSTQADIAMQGNFGRFDLRGEVTGADLFRVVPYENGIVSFDVLPGELPGLIAEQEKWRSSAGFQAPWGFTATLRPGQTTEIALPPELAGRDKLRIAVSSRSAAGGGGRYPLMKRLASDPGRRAVDHPIGLRQALDELLRNGPPGEFHITVIRPKPPRQKGVTLKQSEETPDEQAEN